MKNRAVIQVYVEQEEKEAFEAWSKENGLSASEMLRGAIQIELQTNARYGSPETSKFRKLPILGESPGK